MFDEILHFGGGVIHHGKQSGRIYVLKTPKGDQATFIAALETLAKQNGYGKMIAKVRERQKREYMAKGFTEEAFIPDYYEEGEGSALLAKYFSPERQKVPNRNEIQNVLKTAMEKQSPSFSPQLEEGFAFCKMEEKDIPVMAALYRKVFASYPFPICEENYIRETMADNVIYYGIRYQDRLIGLSSAEMDWEYHNAEMTDFAVDPDYRGKNLASILLCRMEEEAKKMGIRLLYTIARAVSCGMNVTFAKHGYKFAGTLYNNTQISGGIESMNIWDKKL